MLGRLLLAPAAALLLLAWAAAPALAGGWAVTTLDAVPADLQAGQTYRIGYTIRQHGQRPFAGAATSIRITDADGRTTVFKARPEGEVGHYVAEVRFPTAGVWQWDVDQDPFAPQALGTVRVGAAAAAAPPAPTQERASPALALLRVALSTAALGAAVLFGLRLSAFLRRPQTDIPADLGPARASR
jgi:hypothetical protein